MKTALHEMYFFHIREQKRKGEKQRKKLMLPYQPEKKDDFPCN